MIKIFKKYLCGKNISISKKKTLRKFLVNNYFKKYFFKYFIISIFSYKKYIKRINLEYEKEK